jgi:hypothetical protein
MQGPQRASTNSELCSRALCGRLPVMGLSVVAPRRAKGQIDDCTGVLFNGRQDRIERCVPCIPLKQKTKENMHFFVSLPNKPRLNDRS